jgi:nicotinamide phosphoribosyltransferase
MYPGGTTRIYSNLTPRKSREKGVNEVVVFGIQYFVLEYLIEQWNSNFFHTPLGHIAKEVKQQRLARYKRMMDNTLGKDTVKTEHIEKLWDLGYMPLKIKALAEGTLCPIGIPCLTITNTVDHAFWLVNYLETILSCTVWQPMTSATKALQYRKILEKYALQTTGSIQGVQWQGHDFSMRGMSSLESACTSGAGHLLSFTGTDIIPAIEFLEQYYGANVEEDLVGASVPATEHSVMCMGLKDGEINTFERLLDLYPTGILSVVSDTWDLWNVVKKGGICDQLKSKILARNGKLVIRPDSGDPVDIICGQEIDDIKAEDIDSAKLWMKDLLRQKVREETPHGEAGDPNPSATYKFQGKYYKITLEIEWNRYDKQFYFIDGCTIKSFEEVEATPAMKGVIECLYDVFGGTRSTEGYIELIDKIGAIYGDSITEDRAERICSRLMAKGYASTNVVFGIGSFTYQHNTRDTFGFAMKATYGEVAIECGCGEGYQNPTCLQNGNGRICTEAREIFKDPITDSGEKKSARGLLRVDRNEEGKVTLYQQQTKEQEEGGLLQTIFLDGKMVKTFTLTEVRENLKNATK